MLNRAGRRSKVRIKYYGEDDYEGNVAMRTVPLDR